MTAFNVSSLTPVLPEIVLALGAMVLLMVGAYRDNSVTFVNVGAIVLLVIAAFVVARIPGGSVFGGSFIVDDYARFMKILAYIGSAFAIIMSVDYMAAEKERKFEYSILILLST